MHLLTVATASYLDQVATMFKHIEQVHPELQKTVLVADCAPDNMRPIFQALGPSVDVLCCADLKIDYLEEMREYYSTLEFCSALKILGSAHVLASEDQCLFLDPDMVVFDSLQKAVLDQPGEVVVSCHTFTPYPGDGSAPNDLELCLSGHINGGVLLTRRGSQGTPAIDWLVQKTRFEWFVAPHLGMYADQQWLSALPYLFRERTTIVADRGVNVAYWNLHERPMRRERTGEAITIADGGPLRLMHFSGFSVPSDGRLTKHSTRQFDDATEKVLAELIGEYEASLIAARAKLGHIKGDLGFSNLPLAKRMEIARARGGVQTTQPQATGLPARLHRAARSIYDSLKA